MRKNSLFAAVLATAALCFVGCSDSNQQQVDLLTQQLDSMKQENANRSRTTLAICLMVCSNKIICLIISFF